MIAAFPAGMIYQTFQATVATAGENKKSIQAVEKNIGEIKRQQGILIERSAAAEKQATADRQWNEENQRETRGLLYDILGRLPSPENARPAR
jgi:pyruvoyl-dependent arginine decarboxylase (PvlArgDC)